MSSPAAPFAGGQRHNPAYTPREFSEPGFGTCFCAFLVDVLWGFAETDIFPCKMTNNFAEICGHDESAQKLRRNLLNPGSLNSLYTPLPFRAFAGRHYGVLSEKSVRRFSEMDAQEDCIFPMFEKTSLVRTWSERQHSSEAHSIPKPDTICSVHEVGIDKSGGRPEPILIQGGIHRTKGKSPNFSTRDSCLREFSLSELAIRSVLMISVCTISN